MQRAFAKCHTERVWLREFLAEVLGTFILVVSTSLLIIITSGARPKKIKSIRRRKCLFVPKTLPSRREIQKEDLLNLNHLLSAPCWLIDNFSPPSN